MEPEESTYADADYLTEKRFERNRSETVEVLERLRETDPSKQEIIDAVHEEDTILFIRYRTLIKCKRQVILSAAAIGVGITMGVSIPLFYFFVFIGIIVLISFMVGLLTNRLTHRQKMYFRE